MYLGLISTEMKGKAKSKKQEISGGRKARTEFSEYSHISSVGRGNYGCLKKRGFSRDNREKMHQGARK